MKLIVIDKKKYVLLPEKEYQELKIKAAHGMNLSKKMSLAAAKKYTNKLINKWAKEKHTL